MFEVGRKRVKFSLFDSLEKKFHLQVSPISTTEQEQDFLDFFFGTKSRSVIELKQLRRPRRSRKKGCDDEKGRNIRP